MRTRRRIAALIALLGVAWATLWPAISAAHASVEHEAMPLCHMAGMMVDPAQAPAQDAPTAPGHEGSGTHCPLCIMAVYVAFHATPEAPPFTFSTAFVTLPTHCAAMPFGIEVQLPESRAPPLLRV
jgi:hypothetical protein